MRLCFFYDTNFRPLRDRLVASLQEEDGFEVMEDFIQDLGVLAGRAGGGIPTYLYKAQKIKDALESIAEGEILVFCDVDIHFLAPVRSIVEEAMSGMDLVLQKEFEDIGVNIGFVAMRSCPATAAFWKHVHGEIERTQALDQRVVNNTLYSGMAREDFGVRWGRFPTRVWASSLAITGQLPDRPVLHHANFTIERSKASDPSLKLQQMDLVSNYVRGDKEGLCDFLAQVAADGSIADYRDRHFGARRPGPEWAELPDGHVARPGGFREKRGKAANKATNSSEFKPSASEESMAANAAAGSSEPKPPASEETEAGAAQ